MGWEDDLFELFDDLEQQAAALYDADRDAELADRSRAEYQHVSLASRLMASVEQEVVLGVTGVGAVSGRLERVTATWCVLRGPAQDWVVRLAAVETVRGASPRSVPEVAWPTVTRLGIGSALRRLSDAGERCVMLLVSGAREEGVPVRVGADFVEVQLPGGRLSLVAFGALAAVQSHG